MYMSILSRLMKLKIQLCVFRFYACCFTLSSFVENIYFRQHSSGKCTYVSRCSVFSLFFFSIHPCSHSLLCLHNDARHFIQFLCLLSGELHRSFSPFSNARNIQYTLFVSTCKKRVSLRQFKMQVSARDKLSLLQVYIMLQREIDIFLQIFATGTHSIVCTAVFVGYTLYMINVQNGKYCALNLIVALLKNFQVTFWISWAKVEG